MRRLATIALIGISCLLACRLQAQTRMDTLREIRVNASKVLMPREPLRAPQITDYGLKTMTAGKATLEDYRGNNLAALLSQQFPVVIRTYGTNGLAALTFRGASSAQTAVRWNGVPMQNGATGVVDLFLVPVAVMEEVSIDFGSAGAQTGSGAVGGTLSLRSGVADFSEGHRVSVSAGAGSFGRMLGAVRLQQATKKWSASVAAIGQQANNDFPYKDQSGASVKMENARYTSGTLQGGLTYRPDTKSTVTGYVWADRHYREIPPALFEQSSVKQQRDAAVRSVVSYSRSLRGGGLGITASFFDEWFRYKDTAAALQTSIHTRQWFLNPSFEWSDGHGRRSLTVSLPQQLNGFAGEPDRQIFRSAVVLSGKMRLANASLSAGARGESVNGKVYGAADLNADYQFDKIKLRAGGGYTYRTPTLNELYYVPGGNKDLQAEKGYSMEAGYTWSPMARKYLQEGKKLYLSHSGTFFYRNMRNWILWLGGAIWTPHNIARVESSGFETENTLFRRGRKVNWRVRLHASYTSSRTAESLIPNDGSIGRQIPYTPRLLVQGNAGFTARKWRFNYGQTFMGTRYYNTDETGRLPAFTTGNVQAGYSFRRSKWSIDLSAQLQNIWDQHYIEVSGRPAQGISWLFGLAATEGQLPRW